MKERYVFLLFILCLCISYRSKSVPEEEITVRYSEGVGVHVGEFGAFNQTPHEAVLAWMKELTGQWKAAGWRFAMWNFRGGFGILDSERPDVQYENYKGHKLDRKMLEVIKES